MNRRQASHVQSASIALKSSAYYLFLILIGPFRVNTVPKRAVLVGNTQSNMSHPRATHTTKS